MITILTEADSAREEKNYYKTTKRGSGCGDNDGGNGGGAHTPLVSTIV